MSRHPAVCRVFYPGLAEFPGHALAKQQMYGFGGMLTIEVAGDAALYHRLGYFSDAMFQSYLHLYNSLLKHLRMPKLLILLKCPLPEILRRIVARGREDEIRAGEQYWCDLYTAYDTFLDVVNAEKAIPNLLILDTATTNLVHNEAHIAAFLDEVRSYLQREDEPDLSACCPPPCGALA